MAGAKALRPMHFCSWRPPCPPRSGGWSPGWGAGAGLWSRSGRITLLKDPSGRWRGGRYSIRGEGLLTQWGGSRSGTEKWSDAGFSLTRTC